MTAFLLDKYQGRNFSVITSVFEDAPLENNAYDLIYAASAFHWVDVAIGCPKAHRLLKPGGVFALMRYNEPGGAGALNDEIMAAYEKHYTAFYTSKQRLPKKSREDYLTPAEIMRGFGCEDMRQFGFDDISMKLYDTTLTFSAEEYIAFIATMADIRGLPESNRTALFSGIKAAILRHGNCYRIAHIFQLYMGRKSV